MQIMIKIERSGLRPLEAAGVHARDAKERVSALKLDQTLFPFSRVGEAVQRISDNSSGFNMAMHVHMVDKTCRLLSLAVSLAVL